MSVQPLVYIYRTILRMSRPGGFPPGLNGLGFSYIGSRPSYMRLSSPYTWPQFRIGIVHFFVASNVDKYRAFKRAVSLGNTLLWRFSFRYVAFRLSIVIVVYITLCTVVENLKMGTIASRFWYQLFIEFGYSSDHFSVTRSKASNAFSTVGT